MDFGDYIHGDGWDTFGELEPQFACPHRQNAPPIPKSKPPPIPPSISFYVHIADARQETQPECCRVYRRKFNAAAMEGRHLAAEARRRLLKQLRVEQLTERLDWVATLVHENHMKRTRDWLRVRDQILQDMEAHVQRRNSVLTSRQQKLRAHNHQVKLRAELLGYRNYLESIAEAHERENRTTVAEQYCEYN